MCQHLLQKENLEKRVNCYNYAMSVPLLWYILTSSLLCCIVFITLIAVPPKSYFLPSRFQIGSIFGPYKNEINEPACTPRNHIVFLKTHKCASTTIQNIFLRYGYSNDLTFALPKSANYLGNGRYFKASMLPKDLTPEDGKVDIFCVHSRLDVEELIKIIHKDTVWITILREPGHLLESLFNFYHMQNFYNMSLQRLLWEPLEKILKMPRYGEKLGPNQMLYDLGANENLNVLELKSVITALDYQFDLVLIAERIEESLILMKDTLCWTMKDIVYFKKNARRAEVKRNFTEEMLNKMNEVNSADSFLYDHFLSKHRRKVREFGEDRMREEVRALRELIDDYREDCDVGEVKGWDKEVKFKEYSSQVSGFTLGNSSHETCKLVVYPELTFLEKVRDRQRERLKIKKETNKLVHS